MTFSLGSGAELHYVVVQNGAPNSATQPIIGLKPGQSYGSSSVVPGSVNGAMLVPGYHYTLNFSTPGVYTYHCEVHGGQDGVIVVQPKGTSLPYTPQQYQAVANQEIHQALGAGDAAVGRATLPKTIKNANGTTTYEIPAGISPSQQVTTSLKTGAGDSIGSVSLNPVARGLSVQGAFTGLKANTKYTLQLDNGIVGHIQGPVTSNSSISFTTNSSGVGSLSTEIPNSPHSVTSLVPPGAGWVLALSEGATSVSSANVQNTADASALAFVPNTLVVKAGDTIKWTEMAPQEAHTVTFLATGQTEPNPFSPPSGGHTVAGHTYFNSGLLTYQKSYSLTFTKPGVYPYLCLLHNDYGMTGTVVVEPASQHGTPSAKAPQGPTYFGLLHHTVGSMGSKFVPAQRMAATLYYTYHIANDKSYMALLAGSGTSGAKTIAHNLANSYHVTR